MKKIKKKQKKTTKNNKNKKQIFAKNEPIKIETFALANRQDNYLIMVIPIVAGVLEKDIRRIRD